VHSVSILCVSVSRSTRARTHRLTWNANASQAVLRRVLEPSVADADWADAQTMTALETHLRRRMQTLQVRWGRGRRGGVVVVVALIHVP
jgi:hypothetical protein